MAGRHPGQVVGGGLLHQHLVLGLQDLLACGGAQWGGGSEEEVPSQRKGG